MSFSTRTVPAAIVIIDRCIRKANSFIACLRGICFFFITDLINRSREI